MSKLSAIDTIVSKAMDAYIKENYEESITLFEEVLSHDPDHKASLTSRGSAYLRMNQLESAIADFDRVIQLNPDYARAFHLRGLAKSRMNDNASAVEDLNRAIELNPEYGAAYASRATVHQNLGNEELAIDDVQTVTALTHVNLETFSNENNIVQSQQMRVEDAMETELNR